MALYGAALVVSSYTPDEGNLYEAFLHSKATMAYFTVGMLFIKTLLLRELALFDILTLFIILSSIYSMS